MANLLCLCRIRRNAGNEKGQATVELAFLLPVVVIVVLLFVQISAVFIHRLELSHAVREAVRIAAVDASRDKALEAGRRATGLQANRLQLTIGPRPAPGGFITVAAAYDDPVRVPLTNAVLFTVRTQASATMLVED